MNTLTTHKHEALTLTLFFAVMTLASACGLTGSNSTTTTAAQTNPTTTIITTPPSTNPADLGSQVAEQGISVYGAAPTTVVAPFRSDRYLKVRITPTEATSNTSNPPTPYVADYSCATFRIQVQVKGGSSPYTVSGGTEADWYNVNGTGFTTALTKVPGTNTCSGGVDARIQDFSSSLPQGHGLIRLNITALRTDSQCLYITQNQTQCMNYGYLFNNGFNWQGYGDVCYTVADLLNSGVNYCPSSAVYSTHTVNANVEIGVAP